MDQNSSGITVSPFDYSVESHFNAMSTIRKLCGTEGEEDFDETEIERFDSRVTFIREWRQYYYKPRTIRFSCGIEAQQGKDVIGEVNLPQFSAANVPKTERSPSDTKFAETSKDFVLYVGGHVWGLDWCPSMHQWPDCHLKCEYLAVAAHPPESSYHKIGAPLTGRGVVQIWCILHAAKGEEQSPLVKIQRKKTKNQVGEGKHILPLKRPRGRPRKESLDDSDKKVQMIQASSPQLSNPNDEKTPPPKRASGRPKKKKDMKDFIVDFDTEEPVLALAVDTSQVSSEFLALTDGTRSIEKYAPLKNRDKDVGLDILYRGNQVVQATTVQLCNADEKKSLPSKKARRRTKKRKDINVVDSNTENESVLSAGMSLVSTGLLALTEATGSTEEHALLKGCDEDLGLDDSNRNTSIGQDLNVADNELLDVSTGNLDPPKDVALPRVVLCLAHNGKVAWDVKWRPPIVTDLEHKSRMGYLAVLLGNGSLEVWEVPSPRAIDILYSSCKKEGTDPRFVKLEPVFRCSMLKSGDRHSIPLTVEWSTSSPHDLLLAGCHDGTVALWKFSANVSSQGTRPLLCFSADTLPIRALAWAPDESDEESANIIVTAGDGGLRFWDMREPFRPLWDLNPVRRFIYSVDWLQDPRCVIMSFDDGTLRILSLSKAANNVPVTGKPFVGTQHQGLHSYSCSSFPIWSVQASRLSGQVAYCNADGSVVHFQLTSKAVDNDHSRYRAPHYLCGSLTKEDAAITVNSPLPSTPFPLKKSLNESGGNSRKKGNDQVPDDEPLALCYGDDPSFQIAPGDILPIPKAETTTKRSSTGKSYPDSVPVANLQKGEKQEEARADIEVLPPKIVAMHRVRWNMNKGSERWVCYGGAAGIVRCQEIS